MIRLAGFFGSAKMLPHPGGHAMQLIAVDLQSPEQNISRFSDAICRLGDSQHCMPSVWLVKSSLSNALIKRVLQPHLGEDDRLIITGLSDNYAEVGLPLESTDWVWEDTIQEVGTTGAPREQLHE